MKSIVNLIKKQKILGMLFFTFFLFAFMVINDITKYWFDSADYIELSECFREGGHFVFDASRFSLRAYTWPLMLAFLRGFCHFDKYIYWLLLSGMYAFLYIVVIGDLFEEILHLKISIVRRSFPIILTMIFWPGMFLYPLSDLIAVLVSMLALYFLVIMDKADSNVKIFFLAMLAGVMVDSALNIRATYKVNILLGGIILLLSLKKKKNFVSIFLALLAYVIGIGLSATPQIYANYINYGKISINNPLSFWNSDNRAVYLLFEGAIIPRYETFVGVSNEENIGAAFHGYDPIIKTIYQLEGIDLSNYNQSSIWNFIKLVLKYPLEFLTVYFSHLINCFDVRYGDIYIYEFGGIKRDIIQILSSIFYSIFVVGSYLRIKVFEQVEKKKIYGKKMMVYIYILLPTLISLPGHIEPRYAISMHILMYIIFSYQFDLCEIMKWIRQNIIKFIALTLCILVLLTLICNWSLALSGYHSLLY